MSKFSPYSFSKISTFEQCPLKFKFTYIDKLGTFEPSVATERGSYIHLLLENLVKEKPTEFNFKLLNEEQIQECNQIFEKFKESEIGREYLSYPSEAEVHFGLKKGEEGVQTCSYYDKEALFRGKIDYFSLRGEKAVIADWKTGKVTNWPQPLQLIMYAVWAFLEYPELQEVDCAFVYVEHAKEKRYSFKRGHLTPLFKKMLEKVIAIEKDTEFKKKEGVLCDWCEFRKRGICQEDVGQDFQPSGFTYKRWYYYHPESHCVWSSKNPPEVELADDTEEVFEISKERYLELKNS